jgi:hypothetical protein
MTLGARTCDVNVPDRGHWDPGSTCTIADTRGGLSTFPRERRGAPRGRRPAEQAFRAQVLVNLGPMNAEATAGGAPVGALGRGGGEKARIPDKRHGDGTAVQEIDDKGVLGEPDVPDTFTRANL